MKNLKFYFVEERNELYAYNRESEFFVAYIPKKQTWNKCLFSFTEFQHDGNYSIINEQEASKLTKGNLPTEMFNNYIETLNKTKEL